MIGTPGPWKANSWDVFAREGRGWTLIARAIPIYIDPHQGQERDNAYCTLTPENM